MASSSLEDDSQNVLACGARSLACFSYVDPTNQERVGVKLLLQACLCPAAVLAANISLLDGEDAVSHSHGIPCADGFAIGPRGLEEYRRMCRSQLTCGIMCMGLPVVYTENLIQRQRIRGKYGLRYPTSLSEIGAGCCYPCSIFQSHTFLYVTAHHAARLRSGSGANGSHGPLLAALRAMQRVNAGSGRSQDVTTIQQDMRAASAVAPLPRPPEQPRISLHEPCVTPPRLQIPEPDETTPTAVRQGSMSLTATGANGAISAGCVASSVGETPDQVVTLFGRARTGTRRAHQHAPTTSASSAESRSTPASGSIPPPEVTDSPRVGAGPAVPTYTTACSHDEAESALADSTSFPIPSALPISTVRSPPKFEVPKALKPPDSADSEVISAWMQGPKLSHLSQTLQRHADDALNAAEQTSSVSQPSKPPAAGPTASGLSASDASLFSLAIDPSASHASQLPPPPQPSVGTAASALSACTAGSAARGPTLAQPAAHGEAPLPLPLPTPGSSRDLHAPAYDTITSSKLSSMIDHAMLNGSGSAAGRGSGSAAGGGGTALSSIDPAGPWDSYRMSTMTPIAEADTEEGTRCESTSTMSRVLLEGSSAAESTAAAGRLASAFAAASGQASASDQRHAAVNSRNSQRVIRANGVTINGMSSGAGSSSGSNTRGPLGSTVGGGQRGSGGGPVISAAAGAVVAGGAALTALARMGSDSGSNTIGAPGGSGRSGNVYVRNNATAPPPPRRAPPAMGAQEVVSAQQRAAAATTSTAARDADSRVTSARSDEDDYVDYGVGASADNFSLAATTPQQVLLAGAPQMLQRQASQSRYGTAVAAPPAPSPPTPVPAPALVGVSGDDDDGVNFASIRPSFIDGPEMDRMKEALRAAGEKADAAGTSQAATAAAATAGLAARTSSSSAASGSHRVVALNSTVTAWQQRGSGSRRYGAAQPAAAEAAAAGAGGRLGSAAAAAPYASFCGDAASQDTAGGGSLDEDASSVIDGPVSSGEATSAVVAVHRPPAVTSAAAAATAVHRNAASASPASSDPGTESTASGSGDASVSVAVAGPSRVSDGGPTLDPAESGAFGPARCSASGLSNGESNVGYDGVGDSVCASQHRQKHWINWMAQSVGMSMANNSVAVGESSRAMRPAAAFAGKGATAGSSHLNANQRLPQRVLEESGEGLYRRWG